MLGTNWLLEKLRNSSKPCIGTWITIPSCEVVDVICSTGPDFVVIDTEHSPIDFRLAQQMMMACESRKVSPVFRVPGLDDSQILRALEIGAHAVQLPNVSDSETAMKLVKAARYEPEGQKGLSPYTRTCGYSTLNVKSLIKGANMNTLLTVQVEGAQGIESIDSILQTKGIDICFLGLFDLSNYLGIPGELDHPRLRVLFADLVKKITDAGVVAGSISNDLEQLQFLLGSGVRYITHSADCELLSSSFRQVFSSRLGGRHGHGN